VSVQAHRDARGVRTGFGLAPGLVAFVILAGTQAAAGPVALLTSGSFPPYAATAAAFCASYHDTVTSFACDDHDSATVKRAIQRATPDVIVAVGIKAAQFARDHFPRTPLVYCVVHGPERYDLIGSWVTGVSADVPAAAQLGALRKAAPAVRHVLFVRDASDEAALRAARAAASQAGIELVDLAVRDASEVAAGARELAPRADAVWLTADRSVATPEVFRYLLQLSIEQKKPMLVFSESLVRAGALVAVAPDYEWIGARVAELVARIESGERAGDLAVVPLKRTRVVVNPATAHLLGLAAPETVVTGVEER